MQSPQLLDMKKDKFTVRKCVECNWYYREFPLSKVQEELNETIFICIVIVGGGEHILRQKYNILFINYDSLPTLFTLFTRHINNIIYFEVIIF